MYGGFNDGGQLSQLLMRRLNLTGDSPVPVLMPELGANLVYENDRVEWGFPKGELHFEVGTQTAAVAGETGRASFYGAPGYITVVEELIVSDSSGTGTAFAVMRPTEPAFTLPAIVNPACVDDRFGDLAPGTFTSGTSAVAVTGPRVLGYQGYLALTPVTIAKNVVLTGRQRLVASVLATNRPLNFQVRGYVRRALPGELV